MSRYKTFIFCDKNGRQHRIPRDIAVHRYNSKYNETSFDDFSTLDWLNDNEFGKYAEKYIYDDWQFVGVL